mmetsp:Transcript_39456/g.92279  ORF Transcript_39456/g.92279 Transcript_39456/m.92279 type:complete len:327 (-) Transcript_39456:209-1189(-)
MRIYIYIYIRALSLDPCPNTYMHVSYMYVSQKSLAKHLLGKVGLLALELLPERCNLCQLLLDGSIVGCDLSSLLQISLRLVRLVHAEPGTPPPEVGLRVPRIDLQRLRARLFALGVLASFQVAHRSVQVAAHGRCLHLLLPPKAPLIDELERFVVLADRPLVLPGLEGVVANRLNLVGRFVKVRISLHVSGEVGEGVCGVRKGVVEPVILALLELPAVADHDRVAGLVVVRVLVLHPADAGHTLEHLAKHHVLSVQVGRLRRCDEELAPVGPGARVCHRKETGGGVLVDEVLVLKLLAVDRFAPRSVAVGEVASLAHELGDDPVEA